MKEFEMRNVGSHIEVYTAGGVFLFSIFVVKNPLLCEGNQCYNKKDGV